MMVVCLCHPNLTIFFFSLIKLLGYEKKILDVPFYVYLDLKRHNFEILWHKLLLLKKGEKKQGKRIFCLIKRQVKGITLVHFKS
jgi:hypothetical protein